MNPKLTFRETDQEDQTALQALTDSIILDTTGNPIGGMSACSSIAGVRSVSADMDEDASAAHRLEGCFVA